MLVCIPTPLKSQITNVQNRILEKWLKECPLIYKLHINKALILTVVVLIGTNKIQGKLGVFDNPTFYKNLINGFYSTLNITIGKCDSSTTFLL